MYQWLNMAQYRVHVVYAVLGHIQPLMYTTCTGCMSDV